RYSLRNPRTTRDGGVSSVRAGSVIARRLFFLGFERLLPRRRLARRLLLVGRAVERRAGLVGDLAHHRPVLLVGDREEAVGAAERLPHLGREAVFVETSGLLLREVRREIVRVGERRGREQLALVD